MEGNSDFDGVGMGAGDKTGASGAKRQVQDSEMAKTGSFEKMKAYFPHARHKDWYDGHSWASGIFPMVRG